MQRPIGQDLLPGFVHGGMTHDAQAARMDADDFFVVGPDLHEPVGIGLLKGFVESVLGFVGSGEHGCGGKRAWRGG